MAHFASNTSLAEGRAAHWAVAPAQGASADVGFLRHLLQGRSACRWLLLRGIPTAVLARSEHGARTPENGWSGQVELDYDRGRARTQALRAGFEVAWGSSFECINLAGDLYGELDQAIHLKDDGYLTLELGRALYRDHEQRRYLNAMVEVAPHSRIADRGWDLSPAMGEARGITSRWWVGGELGGVFATASNEGNRRGYAQLSLWATWRCRVTPQGGDALSLGVWVAGNEVPGGDNGLFVELEYALEISEGLEAKCAVGTDPVTPWEPLGVYLSAGLTWPF